MPQVDETVDKPMRMGPQLDLLGHRGRRPQRVILSRDHQYRTRRPLDLDLRLLYGLEVGEFGEESRGAYERARRSTVFMASPTRRRDDQDPFRLRDAVLAGAP